MRVIYKLIFKPNQLMLFFFLFRSKKPTDWCLFLSVIEKMLKDHDDLEGILFLILFIQFVVTIFFLSKNHSLWFISQSYTPPHIELYVFFCDWGSCRFIFLLLFFFFLLLMRNVSIFLFYFKICGNRCLFHVFISNLFTIWSYFAWICYLF